MNITKLQKLTATIVATNGLRVDLGQYGALLDATRPTVTIGNVKGYLYAPVKSDFQWILDGRHAGAKARRAAAYAHPRLEDVGLEALRLYIAATGGTVCIHCLVRPSEAVNARCIHPFPGNNSWSGDTSWGATLFWRE